MGILKIITQAGALALPAFGEVGLWREAGGAQPGNPCGVPRLYGRTPYEKKKKGVPEGEQALPPELLFSSFHTAYWGDTFVYPIRLSSTSLAASLPSLMAHTTSD